MRDQDDATLRFQDNVAHQERFNSAVKHLRRVIGALQEANVAEDHPDLLSHRQYLAELLAQGNEPNMLRKAEELLQLIIPSLCDRFGVAHLCTQRAMSTLVFLLEDEGKDEEAEPWKLHLQTHAARGRAGFGHSWRKNAIFRCYVVFSVWALNVFRGGPVGWDELYTFRGKQSAWGTRLSIVRFKREYCSERCKQRTSKLRVIQWWDEFQ